MKIICDTHVLLFDALTPERLSPTARRLLEEGEARRDLACSGITLWEIAMLIAKGRVQIATDSETFLQAVVAARGVEVLPITVEVAARAQSSEIPHGDPADRLIAATALAHGATLVTRDEKLRSVEGLRAIW
ncbi:type II toxin-antitoxin system VapC family toxin [Endothiovibrio diazotrophicus]